MKKALAILSLVTVSAIGARADVIAAWDVSGHGSPADTTLNATTINAAVSNTPALARTGLTGSAANNSFSSSNWNTGSFNQSNQFISFDITASSNITLTDLQYSMNGSNTGPRNGIWGYSLDGGTTFTLGTTDGTGGNPQLANAAPSALADWDFTDFALNSGSTVEFRFWASGTQGIGTGASASTGTARVANISGNDLVLNGTTAVPEPTTIGLIGLGLAGVVAFARRRKA